MKRQILVLDFGTSNVRANLIDIENGKVNASVSKKYTWQYPSPGFVEIDALEIWHMSEDVVEGVLAQPEAEGMLEGISFSFFGDGIICVDKYGEPLTNVIVQMDNRAVEQARTIGRALGERHVQEILCWPITLDIMTGAKILWMKENQQDIFDKSYFYTLQQFIMKKLGMPSWNDFTVASRMMLLDIKNKCWSKELLDFIGINEEQMGGEPKASTTVVGETSRYGRVELPRCVPVVLGIHDAEAGMIGLGVGPDTHDKIGGITGTFDHLGYFVDSDEHISLLPDISIVSGPFDSSYTMMSSAMAGANYEWYIREISEKKEGHVIKELFEQMNFTGDGKLLFLPRMHMQSGVMYGMSLSDTKLDIFRAFVEGITFAMKPVADQYKKISKGKAVVCRCGGGGSQSDRWLQLKADVFGLRMESVENYECSALGAAIIGSLALGVYSDVTEAANHMVNVKAAYEPRIEAARKYQEKYEQYMNLLEKC